jgi:hypothetical protein
MKRSEIEKAIRLVNDAGGPPRDRQRRLLGLAEVIAGNGGKTEAYELGRTVFAENPEDPEIVAGGEKSEIRLQPHEVVSVHARHDSCRLTLWVNQ